MLDEQRSSWRAPGRTPNVSWRLTVNYEHEEDAKFSGVRATTLERHFEYAGKQSGCILKPHQKDICVEDEKCLHLK